MPLTEALNSPRVLISFRDEYVWAHPVLAHPIVPFYMNPNYFLQANQTQMVRTIQSIMK